MTDNKEFTSQHAQNILNSLNNLAEKYNREFNYRSSSEGIYYFTCRENSKEIFNIAVRTFDLKVFLNNGNKIYNGMGIYFNIVENYVNTLKK